MRSDIVPGATFPDYELSDHRAKRQKLSDLQGPHPMVLVLSRGGYCPKDRRQSERLLELHREMEVGYCRLVTISTDNITETNEYRSGVGAHWPFLSDARRIVQKDLDIAEYTDPDHNPMIPHVIVLEPGLVIYEIYNGYWFFGRPTMEELRQDLRAVTMKCRPDWDITRPDLKAAWQQGRKDLFYPYGKTYAQTIGEQDWKRRIFRAPTKYLVTKKYMTFDVMLGALHLRPQSRRAMPMKLLTLAVLAASLAVTPSIASADTTDHSHDFDFLVGKWRVHHSRLNGRLVGSHDWVEFDGTSEMWMTMNGRGTFDDNYIGLPSGPYRAVGIRCYDPSTQKWAIWWLDERHPHAIEPPVYGNIKDGVGTFIGDDVNNGKPVLQRFTWSNITANSAHWEQALSPDGGKTWETNWRMDLTRVQ